MLVQPVTAICCRWAGKPFQIKTSFLSSSTYSLSFSFFGSRVFVLLYCFTVYFFIVSFSICEWQISKMPFVLVNRKAGNVAEKSTPFFVWLRSCVCKVASFVLLNANTTQMTKLNIFIDVSFLALTHWCVAGVRRFTIDLGYFWLLTHVVHQSVNWLVLSVLLCVARLTWRASDLDCTRQLHFYTDTQKQTTTSKLNFSVDESVSFLWKVSGRIFFICS